MAPAFVDTNVVVYAYDRDEPNKRAIARSILGDHRQQLVISTQVLAEFYWVATRRLARPLADADAATVVDTLAELTVVGADAELVRSAISLARRQQISSWDALIIRAAQVAGCDRLLTEDLQHDARFDDVRVENPFAQIAR